MKAVEPQRNTGGRFVMTADPAILKRIRGCPFAGGGRVLVRFRANGYSLFARRSGEPLARLRLTGNSDEVVLLYPSHRGGWGALGDFGTSAMALDKALQCLSDNPYFLDLHETTVEPLQRIDAKQECCSLETTGDLLDKVAKSAIGFVHTIARNALRRRPMAGRMVNLSSRSGRARPAKDGVHDGQVMPGTPTPQS